MHLNASQGRLGTIFDRLWRVSGRPGEVLGRLEGVLGRPGGVFESSWPPKNLEIP